MEAHYTRTQTLALRNFRVMCGLTAFEVINWILVKSGLAPLKCSPRLGRAILVVWLSERRLYGGSKQTPVLQVMILSLGDSVLGTYLVIMNSFRVAFWACYHSIEAVIKPLRRGEQMNLREKKVIFDWVLS